MKVFFISFEVTGIFKTGGLGDVAAALPKALKKSGINVSIIMPGYNGIRKPALLPCSNVPVYYIKDHSYFDLNKKYTHAQDFERYFYFCRKCVDLIEREKPDVVHLNDWHTGLIGYLLKLKVESARFDREARRAKFKVQIPKIVLTIHNAGYQGDFAIEHLEDFKNKKTKADFLKLNLKQGRINFLKKGIDYADFVNTVSPNYANEMLFKGMSYGLEKHLKKKGPQFSGILNGIDYSFWHPAKDKHLAANYSLEKKGSIPGWEEGKKINKVALQRKLKLPIDSDIPVIAFVARLSWQKGIEKIVDGIVELSKMGLQLIILGTGDKYFENKLEKLKSRYEDKFLSVRIKFDELLAHQIYAGSDLFLIPSKYEPCGLTQMIAMKYGTIPLARKTGGLVDSIVPGETGFLFGDDTPKPMLNAIKRATGLYFDWVDWKQINKNHEVRNTNQGSKKSLDWPKMVERVMKKDFSWDKSAKEYIKIYNKLLNK